MEDQMWFDDMPVICELLPLEATAILRQVREQEVAKALEATQEEASHTLG